MKNKTTTPKAAKKASKATAHKDRKEENSLQDIICRHRAKARALLIEFSNKYHDQERERVEEQAEYEGDVCTWYSRYFTQDIIKDGRAAVGMIINPAKNNTWIALEKLLGELSLKINVGECKAGTFINEETGMVKTAYKEISSRLDANSIAHCFAVISSLLETIANTWSDTAAIALATKFHWDYLTRETKGGLISDRWYLDDEEKKQEMEEKGKHYRDFYANLRQLSNLLLQPPQENIIKTAVRAEIRKHEHESDGKKTRQSQLERAVDLIKEEHKKGKSCSFGDAAKCIINNPTEDEKTGCGYRDAESLTTQLYKHAKELEIEQFKSLNRGRPHKQKKR